MMAESELIALTGAAAHQPLPQTDMLNRTFQSIKLALVEGMGLKVAERVGVD
jgi:hypothetical protein